jgi:hypothetical protein
VVDAGMAQICATPMAAAAWPGLPRYRRLVLRRFPYVLETDRIRTRET